MKRLLLAACLVACGDENEVPKDAGPRDAAVLPLDASCFENPQTHYEIINACTTAQKIYKPGRPPLQNADGSLPALPP